MVFKENDVVSKKKARFSNWIWTRAMPMQLGECRHQCWWMSSRVAASCRELGCRRRSRWIEIGWGGQTRVLINVWRRHPPHHHHHHDHPHHRRQISSTTAIASTITAIASTISIATWTEAMWSNAIDLIALVWGIQRWQNGLCWIEPFKGDRLDCAGLSHSKMRTRNVLVWAIQRWQNGLCGAEELKDDGMDCSGLKHPNAMERFVLDRGIQRWQNRLCWTESFKGGRIECAGLSHSRVTE